MLALALRQEGDEPQVLIFNPASGTTRWYAEKLLFDSEKLFGDCDYLHMAHLPSPAEERQDRWRHQMTEVPLEGV